MMTDPVGNVLPTAYELSIEGRTITAADKIRKAIWTLAHAQAKRRTKTEMREDVEKAAALLMDAKELIDGSRT